MIEMLKKFKIVLLCLAVMTGVSFLLYLDYVGVSYTYREPDTEPLPEAVIERKENREKTKKTCMVLVDNTENSNVYRTSVEAALYAEHVGYDIVNMSNMEVPNFDDYETVVVAFENLELLGSHASKLVHWVENGGRAMLYCTPASSPVFQYMAPALGIRDGGTDYVMIASMELKEGFMIGGESVVMSWEEPMPTALNLLLEPSAEVFAVTYDTTPTPLVWRNHYGKGCFVVNNHGLADKGSRGLVAAAYNLLEDISVHPVINAATWFLDDFPSPVPMGDSQYVRKQYGRDISSFYSSVWWPDMLMLCDTYGVRYTGVVIETYEDEVDGVFPRQTDRVRFSHFGNMLLDYGGEIGIHGYNHQPFCFNGFRFESNMDYNTWPSEENIVKSMTEVKDFIKLLYPEVQPQVYVPPSNILSDQGRKMFTTRFPYIKTISSLFLEGECSYEQEFEIADDGIIEFPRVISGAVLDVYMRWVALNCLNLYYVNSHFIHPDDVLDEDRGAAEGWEKLYENLVNYMDWLYTSAPNIRNTTGTEAANATARYDVLSVEKTRKDDGDLQIRLDGLWDEAYLMLRFNTGFPGEVTGGDLEQITGDFYLLHATSDIITVHIENE